VHLGDALDEGFYSLGQLVDSTVACLLIFGKFLKPSLVLLGEFTQASVGLGSLLRRGALALLLSGRCAKASAGTGRSAGR
jgi:hypothetical protein